MVSIIAGNKGKGKTKYLLDMANESVLKSEGSVVYLDKSSKHMYELSNKIRLVNVNDYPINTSEAFVGFVCGLISQNRDIQEIYLDSFLKLSSLEGEDITPVIDILEKVSEKYSVKFILSVSMDAEMLPENAKKDVVVSL